MSSVKEELPSNEEVIDEIVNDMKNTCDLKEYDSDNFVDCEDSELGDAQDEFKSADVKNDLADDYVDEEMLKDKEVTYSDEDKVKLKNDCEALKNEGNSLFKAESFKESITKYTMALRTCPLEYNKLRAVLYANRAAAKVREGRTELAIEDCSKAIELDDVYVKAYIRRAKLYEENDKLDEALGDYNKILELDRTNPDALQASVRLPPLIEQKNERMKAEMLGKLKDLGNTILRPFGLSTENFQMVQNPDSGGYSINFKS